MTLASLLAMGTSAMATTVNLRGVITNMSGVSIPGVLVTLKGQRLQATTDTRGSFRILGGSDGLIQRGSAEEMNHPRFLPGKGIQFSVSLPGLAQTQIFDLSGKVRASSSAELEQGHWILNPGNLKLGTYLGRLRTAEGEQAFQFTVYHSHSGGSKPQFIPVAGAYSAPRTSAFSAIIVDSLLVTKAPYLPTTIGISAFVDSGLIIALDSAGSFPFPTSWVPGADYQAIKNVPHGKLQKSMPYNNLVLNMTRHATVYTPPGYDPTKKYPVLYALHGIGGNELEWVSFNTNINYILDNLLAANKIVPMIVVFPNGRAMNPDKCCPSDGMYGATNSNAFYAFWDKDFRDYLIPFIEKTFSTYTDKAHRAVLGYSMGGGQALRFGLGNPNYFEYVGGLGPAFWPDANSLNASALNSAYKEIFLSTGTSDATVGYQPTVNFDAALKKKGINHIFVPVQNGKHDGSTWCPGMFDFSQIIFK